MNATRSEEIHRLTEAKHACYDRLHPSPHISTSKGARILYDAVCELWRVGLGRHYERRGEQV